MYGRLTLAAIVTTMGIALFASSASALKQATHPKASSAAGTFGVQGGCKTPLGVKPCWVAGVYNADYTGMNDRNYMGPPAQASGGHAFVGVTDFIVANKGGQPNGTVKSIRVDVPPGVVSNPQATPKCTDSQLMAGTCPSDTQLGIVKVKVAEMGLDAYIGESIYNMTPSGSHCAGYVSDYAFNIAFLNRVDICGTVHKDAPNNLYFTIQVPSGAQLVRSTLIFWGVPGDSGHNSQRGWSCIPQPTPCSPPAAGPSKPHGTPFLTNPTGCVSAGQISTLSLKSTSGQTATAKSKTPVPAIDCAKLPFAPKIKLALTGQNQTKPGKHPTLTATATQTAGQANIKLSQVTLPLSLALDPNNAQHVCSVKDAHADKCPASTLVGSARATTPLLSSPLTGNVYLVQGYRFVNGQRIRTFPALLVELRGKAAVDLNAQTSVNKNAQLVTTFSTLPDLPMSSFALTITGGSRGILVVSRNLCRSTQTAAVVFTGHNGVTKKSNVTMSTPCP